VSKSLILVRSKKDILQYDNRKAIELAQNLGRPLTTKEYQSLKIKTVNSGKPRKLIYKK
jgi:hypothetical protein